mmetsp:Transcript_21819/g.40150  ORF Transcript_21819/g.40150 Transcript_21819/m.40150 type:complete len:244 (-) Transcript_21819:56-787(-)
MPAPNGAAKSPARLSTPDQRRMLSTYLATRVPAVPTPREDAWTVWCASNGVFDQSARKTRPLKPRRRELETSRSWSSDLHEVERPTSTSSSSIIADTCTELKSLYSTSVMNKLFIPISQVPPRGLELRKFAGKPPTCAPDLSVPRSERLLGRWQSMPSLSSQLAKEDLHHIQRSAPGEVDSSLVEAIERGRVLRAQRGGRKPRHRVVLLRGTSHLRGLCEYEGGGGKHTGLHIQCSCCERDEA